MLCVRRGELPPGGTGRRLGAPEIGPYVKPARPVAYSPTGASEW
jgi:hypothetical protein